MNFNNGDIADWIWTSTPIFGHAGTLFYAPVITDPVVERHDVRRHRPDRVPDQDLRPWRPHDRGGQRGSATSWTGTFEETCGDWAPLGPTTRLTAALGRPAGGAAWSRSSAPSANNRDRLGGHHDRPACSVTRNVNAPIRPTPTWTRLDDDSDMSPNRFVTSIYVHPSRPNRAWVSYSGFDSKTPDTPGHVFKVQVRPDTGTSTWTNLSVDFGDLPVNDLVRDDRHRDALRRNGLRCAHAPSGCAAVGGGANGMPNVEVAGLTMCPQPALYAASHGLGAWRLGLR